MKKLAFHRSIALAALAMFAGSAHAAPRAGALRPGSVRYFQDADGPKARLADGREYRLLPVPADAKRPAKTPAPVNTRAAQVQTAAAATVDHRQFYGPIRDQGGRGTCVSFSTIAAIEGVYQRMDPKRFAALHLSEQWANHMQKMVDRRRSARADLMEDNLGSWGASRVYYMLSVLHRYGVPEAASMAYNATADYEAIGEQYESQNRQGEPSGFAAANAPQKAADDFNLDPERLPVTALEKAPYRPLHVTLLSEQQMQDPATLEQIVAAGSDIAFGITLVDDLRNEDDAWVPAENGSVRGGHAMLIVGYNHARQYFIVRNQWGPDPDAVKAGDPDGYARISYDYFRQYAQDGAYVTAVADPGRENTRERLWLRHWPVTGANGQGAGSLNLYRLPGTVALSDPRSDDYRIGTYFDAQGNAYRVNGQVDGDRLTLFLNQQNPNTDPSDLSGTRIQLQLSADGMSWQAVQSAG
jgi:C1A family cysteine protease